MHMPHVWIPPKSDPDLLAQNLVRMANLARSMPPSWEGAGIAHMVAGPSGEYLGKILPGKGLYLDQDLHGFGITKPIPHVYERSLTQRLREIFQDERGAISTYNGIIAARCGGKGDDIVISKVSATSVAAQWSSLWRNAGTPPAGTYSNIPGGAAMSASSTGAWSLGLTAPTGGDKKYLLTFGYTSASAIQMCILADLLVAADNIDSNSNAVQTINSTALTRYTSGKGVMMTFEVSSNTLGSTPSNITVNKYHNQAGTANQSTAAVALTTSCIAGRILPVALGPFMSLASGDYGVQSVEEVTLSAAMGTASRPLCLNLYFPLMFVPGVAAGVYAERDSTIQLDGVTELVTTAGGVLGCLTAYYLTNSTTTGISNFFLRTCAG